ncbi:MAG TPA: outer membrane exchange protein TraA family protein [Polyangia bacterium]|nr:outer membrane exchange protein TraA family protein [Polyangia bacterium]
MFRDNDHAGGASGPRGQIARGRGLVLRIGYRCLSLALLFLVPSVAAAQQAVTVNGGPSAPYIAQAGSGLCMAIARSGNPAFDFGNLNTGTYNGSINGFMETHFADRITQIQGTPLDLSNNNNTGLQLSYGDFVNAVPGCRTGGCDFFAFNDTTTSSASRLRGYINITPTLANRPLHFGIYTDDAVSLTFFDRVQRSYSVVIRPPQLGAPTWRTTNTVTFTQPGLYPIEILYVEIVEHAALELSILDNTFVDFELPANQAGSTNLRTAGFQLALASMFFLTENGQPISSTNPTQCAQCNRQYANLAGNGDCGQNSGFYCNAAAVCAPCDSSQFCGRTCSPCGQAQPYCVNINANYQCAECRDNADCPGGRICDPDTHTCLECSRDEHCLHGTVCQNNRCTPCAADNACAGSSCNCCPSGTRCAMLSPESMPTCVECTQDVDCPTGRRCDTTIGRCVESFPDCNTRDRCGPQCRRCPDDRPYCLLGEVCVACTSDVDCGAGKFCHSGQCDACVVDRRCGVRCLSCGGDTPFCQTSDGTAGKARCVGCTNDKDCPGGRCDTATNTCTPTCTVTCPAGQLCHGDRCVECYGNSQCPCGSSCDVTTGSCVPKCGDSSDCQGDEYCDYAAKVCQPGRRNPEASAECHCCTGQVVPLHAEEVADTSGRGRALLFVPPALFGLLLFIRARRRQAVR